MRRERGSHPHHPRRGGFRDLLPLDAALERALAAAHPVEDRETVDLTEAADRVLAQDLTAPVDVPAFPKATMDGVALSAETVRPGEPLRVVGTAHPGEPFAGTVGPGECVRAATGAPVPPSCDTVLELEELVLEGEEALPQRSVAAGRNVQPPGDDIARGDLLLRRGTLLDPRGLGNAAAVGIYAVDVIRRPRVAVVATGREVKRGGDLRPGEIHDVNSFTLHALLRAHGADPILRDPVPDTYAAIRDAVAEASGHDLAVFSGSTSVGERDHLRDAVEELGEVLFHGVAVRPGMPLLLARVEDALVFGMPGFPASCLLTAYHVLLPVLWKTAGRPGGTDRTEAVLAESLEADPEKTQLVTVRVEDSTAYRAFRHSGRITSVSEGVGYVVVGVGERKKKGERVEVVLF